MGDELRAIRRILVATGLTTESVGAVDAAGRLAEKLGAELHAIHVVEPMSEAEQSAIPGLAEKHLEIAQEELAKFAESHGIGSAELHVRRGEPEGEILRHRAGIRADLLVFGRYGKGGMKRGRLGSIAEQLVRKCPVSTLVVQPEDRDLPTRIGVASDVFQDSHPELSRGITLGRQLGVDEIDLLDVYRIPTGYHMVTSLEDCRERIEKAARDRAAGIIERAQEEFGASPRVRLKLAEGEPATQLAEMVRADDTQMLVIGTHWRTPIAHMLLGRTTERIIREVGCSVWAEKSPSRFQGLIEGLKGLLD